MEPGSIRVNEYNLFNQLVATNANGNYAAYVYNANGIRTAKSVTGTCTSFLLDGGNVIGEVQNGEVTATHLRGANLLSTTSGTNTSYYLFNAHGDVTGIANNAQTVTKAYEYDAFGVEKDPSITDENPFRYCGEYFDKETGTYYLRARYYNPNIGRFTQQDTHWNTANMIYGDNPNKINEREDALGLKTYTYAPSISSIMQSGNLYVYCINNPVHYMDNYGKSITLATIAVKFAIGIGVQFVSDVVTYKISGNQDGSVLSSAGTYLAAGLSSVISFGISSSTIKGVGTVGKIIIGDAVSNVVASGIVTTEAAIVNNKTFDYEMFFSYATTGFVSDVALDGTLSFGNMIIDSATQTKSAYIRQHKKLNQTKEALKCRTAYEISLSYEARKEILDASEFVLNSVIPVGKNVLTNVVYKVY